MRIAIFTPDITSNSLGRTYCLWLLMRANGWETQVFAPRGGEIWGPLRGGDFAANCRTVDEDDPELLAAVEAADLVLAVKPVETSFGRARRLARAVQRPLLLDVDDPDLEAALSWRRPLRRFAKGILKFSAVRKNTELKRLALQADTIVSNPVLQAIYGGPVVPHVRDDRGFGAPHTSSKPSIAFVGTNRKHKGVDILREAVANRQDLGITLKLTDEAPEDARPWEQWVGMTSFDEGLALVENADVVVIPSKDDGYAHGQLPAKLMDAMLAGRAVIVSDIEPMTWAVGSGGLTVEPSSVSALASALGEVASPDTRTSLGRQARERALALFTVEAHQDAFRAICEDAVRWFSQETGTK